jgi:hypothetical protein
MPPFAGVCLLLRARSSGVDAATGSGSGKGCQYNAADAAVGITGFSYGAPAGGSDETTFQSNLATLGPMSICLATGGWQTYTSGVLTAATCGTQVRRCGALVLLALCVR